MMTNAAPGESWKSFKGWNNSNFNPPSTTPSNALSIPAFTYSVWECVSVHMQPRVRASVLFRRVSVDPRPTHMPQDTTVQEQELLQHVLHVKYS